MSHCPTNTASTTLLSQISKGSHHAHSIKNVQSDLASACTTCILSLLSPIPLPKKQVTIGNNTNILCAQVKDCTYALRICGVGCSEHFSEMWPTRWPSQGQISQPLPSDGIPFCYYYNASTVATALEGQFVICKILEELLLCP